MYVGQTISPRCFCTACLFCLDRFVAEYGTRTLHIRTTRLLFLGISLRLVSPTALLRVFGSVVVWTPILVVGGSLMSANRQWRVAGTSSRQTKFLWYTWSRMASVSRTLQKTRRFTGVGLLWRTMPSHCFLRFLGLLFLILS